MTDLLEEFRRPEYTGENRCWPCTVLNTAIVAVLVAGLIARKRRGLAALIAVVGGGAIALRGYVVPYTPQFAPKLAASLPVDPFEHDYDDATAGRDDRTDGLVEPESDDVPTGEEIVTCLLETGVLVPEDDELFLETAFREQWRTEMAGLRNLPLEDLATVADELTPPSISTSTYEGWHNEYVVLSHESGPETILRHVVAVAELAAARALEESVDDEQLRLASARPLRTFLEHCPVCETELITTNSSCCGEATPIGKTPPEKLICPECRVRLFTFDE